MSEMAGAARPPLPATAAAPKRRAAVIDDAFIPVGLHRVPEAERTAVAAALTTEEAAEELNALGLDPTAEPDEILEALTDPDRPLGLVAANLMGRSQELARVIEERRSVRRLVALLEEQLGQTVVACRPDLDLPDLTACDLVLLDYYLEGAARTGDRSREIARSLRAQHAGPADQQVVLMSSVDSVRSHRTEFRQDAALAGAAFAFIGKEDLDERWKVKAHLGMLDRARPHAPALAAYRAELETRVQQASEALLALADDLDIGDYAYLQSQALMSDGHPLGDYVSWLLSSHLTTLAFEGQAMRDRQRNLDELEFEPRTFASTEPSSVVARLFHSALLASNLGPLGPHPRAKTGGGYENFPLVQLGDVFLNAARTQAMVVLSADCDLAFSPNEARPPDGETPVMLVPGVPKVLGEDEPPGPATEGVLHGEEVYRIDWDFARYRSAPLADLQRWLETRGFDTSNRDRLRPLYGLKLQQEFGAHLMRVGPPIMPPLTYAARGRVLIVHNGERTTHQDLEDGDVMLSRHKGQTSVRLTPKLVHALRRAAEDLLERMEEARTAKRTPTKGGVDGDQAKIDSVRRAIEDDDYWIGLVDGVVLNGPGSLKDAGAVCSFVRGGAWNPPSKPRVVFEILDRGAATQET